MEINDSTDPSAQPLDATVLEWMKLLNPKLRREWNKTVVDSLIRSFVQRPVAAYELSKLWVKSFFNFQNIFWVLWRLK